MSTRIMIRAKLIVGGGELERLKLAEKIIKEHLGTLNHPDLLIIKNLPSVGIDQIRAIKKRLAMKPYSAPFKIILIVEAEKITLPAQNAFLKTLEEPPGETLIILLTSKKEALLPTIISRCQIINLLKKSEIKINLSIIDHQLSIIKTLLKSGVGERFLLAQEFCQNRQQAVDFCQNQLVVWRKILRGKISLPLRLNPIQISHLLRQIHQSLILLDANVNPRLIIENLLLKYPK